MTPAAAAAFLERCLAAPLATPLPSRYWAPPPPPREVHPDGTCVDCGATEDDDGGELYAEGLGDLLCSNCRLCHRPGGY